MYLDEFDTSYGSTISVGWDTQREPPLDGPIPGLTPGERNQFGYSWQSDGSKYNLLRVLNVLTHDGSFAL